MSQPAALIPTKLSDVPKEQRTRLIELCEDIVGEELRRMALEERIANRQAMLNEGARRVLWHLRELDALSGVALPVDDWITAGTVGGLAIVTGERRVNLIPPDPIPR